MFSLFVYSYLRSSCQWRRHRIKLHRDSIDNEDVVQLINRHIADEWQQRQVKSTGRCSDEAFVRRIYLDLVGRIPTCHEREQFLSQQAPNKRAKLVDELLLSEGYARHMAQIFDVVLMGRANRKTMSERERQGWLHYLEEAFAQNRSWQKMAREMVLARANR